MTVFIISVLSEIGIFGILKNVQKSFKFEIKPRTEISMVNACRRCFLYFGCKCKFIFLYLFILNERDFRIFFSWQIVSSKTAIFESSNSIRSGRTLGRKTRSIGSKLESCKSPNKDDANKSSPIVILECYHVWIYSVLMREVMRNSTTHASYSEFCYTIDNMDFQIFSIHVNSIQSEWPEEELYGKKEIMIEKEKL